MQCCVLRFVGASLVVIPTTIKHFFTSCRLSVFHPDLASCFFTRYTRKMANIWKVTLCILLQVVAIYCLSFCPGTLSENLRNVVIAGNNVIVGSSSTLYRLTPDMVEVESVMLDSPNRLLVADQIRDEFLEVAVLACGTSSCSLSPITALSDIVWEGD